MLYDYQYNIAAIVATILLFSICMLRRTFVSKSTIVFVVIIINDFAAAVFDAISIFTISYPEKYPQALNYLVCLSYLFFYNMMSSLFLVYIDTKAKIPAMRKPVRIFAIVSTIYYAVTIFSSPWTHWVAYFDENGRYQHGFFMYTLYVIPFLVIIWELRMFYMAKRNFNKYQVISSVCMIAAMGLSVLFQTLFPRMLIGQLNIALVLFFVYMAFENPAYYTYRETQCLNQKAFFEILKTRLGQNKSDFHIVIVTIKDFDYIRHSFGSHKMEELASRISEFLFFTFRRNAFCLSEDKFVILVSDKKDIPVCENKIRDYFKKPIEMKDTTLKAGVAFKELCDLNNRFVPEDIEDMVEFKSRCTDEIDDTDQLMETVLQQKHRREQILHIIKRALEHDEFQVFYQPIYKLKTGMYESAEALIRLFDSKLGFINPEELITIAEENGYIDQIGEVVFRKVCEFICRNDLKKYGIRYIEINLSPLQCKQQNLVDLFSSIMEEYHVRPDWINLEITETADFKDERQILVNINQLNDKGIEFSIDDYGSGFASADYLIKLPVSIVKIDKGILWEAMKTPSAMVVLVNTIKMIKDLGKKTVVEGVENLEMVHILTECNCDYLQGYYYSKPIPETEFVKLLQNNGISNKN